MTETVSVTAGCAAPLRRLSIAVQGAPGCFSEEAAEQLYPELPLLYCREMEDAFHAVLAGRAGALVLPVSNTVAGEIAPHLALAAQHPQLQRVAETQVRIRMCLLAPVGATLETVRSVYSHPVALRQCADFFASNREMAAQAFHDTAGALEYVMQLGDVQKAALASAAAGQYYRAITLARDIQDQLENYTQFWVLQGCNNATE
jgi:prephenate dehydratase